MYKIFFFLVAISFSVITNAQEAKKYDLAVGLKLQKTEQLYWENGVGVDCTSDCLLQKRIHLKLSYLTSRLGSAFNSNAIKQDYFLIGADWHFRSEEAFQILAGLNTGFFHADMENEIFDVLPHNSLLLSVETGISYKFKFPITANLTAGYNLITGNGVSGPGTLFPVFYQMSLYYRL